MADTFALTTSDVQLRRLRVMKTTATAVLLAAAAVFTASSLAPDSTAIGFVRAAAEAAMVGGLADWFAITALFRRPLGLPIPHTALIPTRKDALAESLGDFVTTTFLTHENVGERLADADIVTRVAQWVVQPDNARRLSREVAAAAGALAESVDPADVADIALAAARMDAARRAYAPLLGRLLETTLDDDAHQAMTDIVLTSVHRWLVDNRRDVVLQVKARAADAGPFVWLFTTTNRVDRLVGSAISYLAAAARDRDHDLRQLTDRLLRVLAIDLQDETPIARQVNVEAMRVLDDPALRSWLVDVLSGARTSLQQTLADPDGPAVSRLTGTATAYARRVLTEPRLHRRFDLMLRRLADHVIDRYADEFTRLVETTVERWNGKETARRIELLAGRDLQYIRINGSVVGAIAGIAIHAIGIALGA